MNPVPRYRVKYLTKRAQIVAGTTAGKHGDQQIRPEHLLYGVLRVARDPLGAGLGRRVAATCPASAYAPARLLLAEHNIDLQQFGDDLLASLTA